MDWLTFIASIVASLAWPAAAVSVVFVLRRALNRLLPDLNRVRYKDWELEFGRQVAQARVEIEAGAALFSDSSRGVTPALLCWRLGFHSRWRYRASARHLAYRTLIARRTCPF